MTRYILSFFGVSIFTWEVINFDLEEEGISGGSAQNFERDFDPPTPGTEKDFDSWVDRPFGFRRPPR
jgi:hypothetical protein